MSIQWFPGHIAKARREIREHIKLVDIIIELIDARCPYSSIDFLKNEIKNKKKLLILNKIDLADDDRTKEIIKSLFKNYDKENLIVITLDSRKNDIKNKVDKQIDILAKDIIEKKQKKGIQNVLIKAMVVGSPNVGKSTFINSYVKKKVNNVANTPGVTKDLKWTKISDKILLLDTPGVTIPKFDNDSVGMNLALISAINDNILEKQDLAYHFLDKNKENYFELFKTRYKLSETKKDSDTINIMDEIAKNNGCIKKMAQIDYDKVANLIINDFRKGLIGKITLE